MDNTETTSCFNEVKESFENVYLTEELALLTPRNIKDTVDSWATEQTDKERVVEKILEWLEPYRGFGTDNDLTPEEKHELLKKTIAHAHKQLDSILTKRDRDQEEADRKRFNKLTPEEQGDYIGNMPIRVRGEDHGSCNMEEYQENMEWILGMVLPFDQNKETRFLNLLKSMGYNFIDETNGYPYLSSFLSELFWYEFIICREIYPYKKEIISFNRYKHDPVEEEWISRLNYYKDIGVKNKHRHSATINSTKWAIPFNDFAKLYRKILGLTKYSLTSPIK